MANNRQQRKSFFGRLKLTTTRHRGWEDEEPGSARRVFPSDSDKRHGLVADPKVDRKAEAFITKVRTNRLVASELPGERQTVTVYPAGTA